MQVGHQDKTIASLSKENDTFREAAAEQARLEEERTTAMSKLKNLAKLGDKRMNLMSRLQTFKLNLMTLKKN